MEIRTHEYRAWTGTHMDYDYRDASLWNGLLVAEGDTILLEYTGLKDKNGRKIWEGDILQETFMGEVLEWSCWRVGYERGAFGVYRPLSAGEEEPPFQSFFNDFQDIDRFSVIGNIYENPDLLTKQSNV